MTKLKSCPFCGGKVRIIKGILQTDDCKMLGYTIGCNDVDCFLWLHKNVDKTKLHLHTGGIWFNKEELIEAWNRREK